MRQLSFAGTEFTVPQPLLDAVTSPYFGADGGNVESPIWFCALEPGKGFTQERPCSPKSFFGIHDEKRLYLKPPKNPKNIQEAFINHDGASVVSGSPLVHQVFVLLLTAVLTGRLNCTHLFGKKVEEACINLIDEFQFFQKDRHGLILNAYPISLAKHVEGNTAWCTNQCVKISDNLAKFITLAEWTGMPKLKQYLEWCALTRHNYHTFTSIRRKFSPCLVYCGGRTDKENFFKMWIDSEDQRLLGEINEYEKFSIRSSTRASELNFEYVWLENGEDRSQTLLVNGPFFGPYRSSCLTDPITCELLGIKLRELLSEKFERRDLNERFSKFLPQGCREKYLIGD
ncbi:MAG: hypothetical protein LUC43_08765 [Burkholderiales bacterium]|nr:hypothetical protein [Burkholderiales bacterium]